MQIRMTQRDVERAREILAAHASLSKETGELAEWVVHAVARGIAEGRQEGIKQGVEMTTASNDA
jgi:hypothetical protein